MNTPESPIENAAFLLSQLGAHGAEQFGKRVKTLDLSRPQAYILRMIAAGPLSSQLDLAKRLGLLPSRMVVLIDELSQKGLLERRRNRQDRRRSELVLTGVGIRVVNKLSRIAEKHERTLCKSLSVEEHSTLISLLRKIRDDQGLTHGKHPGFRKL